MSGLLAHPADWRVPYTVVWSGRASLYPDNTPGWGVSSLYASAPIEDEHGDGARDVVSRARWTPNDRRRPVRKP